MAKLSAMPPVTIENALLAEFGKAWKGNGEKLRRGPPHSGEQLGGTFEKAVAKSLAAMLGGVPVVEGKAKALIPPDGNCVEVGEVRVIGGVRPQNFDVGYRPDGVRFVLDAKTLNDKKSVQKNYQNMINDLATEATTVHSRFPHAVVTFVVVIPSPCLVEPQFSSLVGTLERLTGRGSVNDPVQLAEVISLVLWDPTAGNIETAAPAVDSPLRIERFSNLVEKVYSARYQGLPPLFSE